MENLITCSVCGAQHPADALIEFDNELLCADCYNTYTSECDHCGARIWKSDAVADRNYFLCMDCFNSHYFRCADCHAITNEDDACYHDGEDYCSSCYDNICDSEDAIHSYDYKPTPIFYPPYRPENVYLGVELEIDEGGEDTENARDLLDIANDERDNLYIKHDGSLDSGMELVSHPMTLEEHMTNLPWAEICHRSIRLGYTSHDAGTCGLHVHVSRASFGNEEQQEEVIGRILYFMEAHWNELLKFSRRTQSQLDRWSARYGFKDTPKETLDNAKKSGKGRYACVNLQNRRTIEFRIFRGTLRYQSFIAALQLTDSICKAAVSMSDEQFRSMSWSEFVSNLTHTELIEYLKSRRLYVNEIINSEREV